MKPLRVEYDLTTDDVMATVVTANRRNPAVRAVLLRSRRTFATFAVVLVLLAAVFWLVPGGDSGPVAALLAGLLVLAWRWPTWRQMDRHSRRATVAVLATPAGRAGLIRRAVVVAPDGFRTENELATASYQWRAVLDLFTTKDYLYLLLPGPAYLFVPRRAFEFDDDFRRFADAVTHLAEAGGGLRHDDPLGRSREDQR